jgi:hypothetical protein
MPKGKMFTMGLLSMMFAAGRGPAMTRFCGRTIKELGAIPKLPLSIAPKHTCIAIRHFLLPNRPTNISRGVL